MNERPFVFNVDIDMVLADYLWGLRYITAEVKGVDPDEIPEPTDWDLVKSGWPFTDTQDFLSVHRYAVMDRRMFLWLPEIPGASEQMWRLSDAGVHIRIVTHRWITNGDKAAAGKDTLDWLSRRRPDGRWMFPFRTACFLDEKAEIDGDLFVDDAAHNVERIRAGGMDAVVFTQPYNRHVPGPRVDSWEELGDLVLSRAQALGKL